MYNGNANIVNPNLTRNMDQTRAICLGKNYHNAAGLLSLLVGACGVALYQSDLLKVEDWYFTINRRTETRDLTSAEMAVGICNVIEMLAKEEKRFLASVLCD